MTEGVARTLGELDIEPIILHEQANLGKTIIEKFESCSENVYFAIVLLSPDDLGCKKIGILTRQCIELARCYFRGWIFYGQTWQKKCSTLA